MPKRTYYTSKPERVKGDSNSLSRVRLGAEEYAFNSDGACPECSGTGTVREVDDSKLVPDETKTLEEGAVRAWNQFGISWMYHAAGELGVRTDVPFKDLSEKEKAAVPEICEKVIAGVKDFTTIGPDRTMNNLNIRPKKTGNGA